MEAMKVALLGYGFMGGAHLAAMQRIDGVEVVAVASRTRPSADGPARGNLDLASGPLPDSVLWTPDWRALLGDPAIDAVDVCLPTDLHREVILAAFAAGKHVLCEKPMGLTTAECTEIMPAAASSGRIFMVGQVLRFMYPYIYAARFLDEVGRDNVTACTLQRSTGFPQWGGWLTQTERSGGAILDLLCHDLDIALSLFGQPNTIQAVSIGEVDTMRATLKYSSGLGVIVEGGWLAPETAFSAGFTIEIADEQLTLIDNKLTRTKQGAAVIIEIPEHDPYYDEIAYFIDCCRTGKPPMRCLPEDSARAVELSLQLTTSRDNSGREVQWQP
jgi:predicted dehydrogenase